MIVAVDNAVLVAPSTPVPCVGQHVVKLHMVTYQNMRRIDGSHEPQLSAVCLCTLIFHALTAVSSTVSCIDTQVAMHACRVKVMLAYRFSVGVKCTQKRHFDQSVFWATPSSVVSAAACTQSQCEACKESQRWCAMYNLMSLRNTAADDTGCCCVTS